MPEGAKLFSSWGDFYLITGGAAGALIGLQFVVIVLSAEFRMGSADTTRAFATPTIVHFCAVLLVAAGLSAPWPNLLGAGITLVITGLLGVAYVVITWLRARRTTRYTPVLEDWIWHVILPFAAYLTVTIAGVLLRGEAIMSLFEVGAASMLLLFIGIHNAWDTVTWVALTNAQRRIQQPETTVAASEAPQSIN